MPDLTALEAWRIRYRQYLQSDAWKLIRAKVLKRANGICEGCLEAPPTEVHHLSYRHVFDELMFELAALCRECHEKAHSPTKSTNGG